MSSSASFFDALRLALDECDPEAKAAAAIAICEDLRSGALRIDELAPAPGSISPAGRPEEPALVPPREVPARGLGTPEGRELAAETELVVVIGRPTLTRGVQALIAEVPMLYVAAHGARWREAPLHATQVLPRVPRAWLDRPDATPDSAWLDAWLEASGVPSIVYSSCNAVALARDLAALPSYEPVAARVFDMFPQTSHSETMALLTRRG